MAWNIFGDKKKEEPDFDPLHDLIVRKLRKGWLVDYDMKTWEVIACHKYDWGEGEPTTEWELRSGNDTIFLEYDDEDGESYSVSTQIPIGKIDGNIKSYLQTHEDPPEKIVYQGETYYLDEEGGGLFLEDGTGPQEEFLYWDFVDDNDEKFITIEQWGETEFTAYDGLNAEEYQFSNILPRE